MIEQLKLQQDLGQLVKVLDDLLGLWSLQDHLVLLEHLHGLLDSPEQLPGPGNLPGHRGQVAGHWRVRLVLLVSAGHHFDVAAVVQEDALVLLLDSQVRELEVLELAQQVQSPLGAGDALKPLVHEGHDGSLLGKHTQ